MDAMKINMSVGLSGTIWREEEESARGRKAGYPPPSSNLSFPIYTARSPESGRRMEAGYPPSSCILCSLIYTARRPGGGGAGYFSLKIANPGPISLLRYNKNFMELILLNLWLKFIGLINIRPGLVNYLKTINKLPAKHYV